MTRNVSSRLGWLVAAAVVLLAWLAPLGDLAPPAGPVAPTMKRLSDIDAGTPLTATNVAGDAGALFVIAQPGRYCLVGDITGTSGKSGIRIAADDVTIDIGGYTLRGVSGSLSGITTGDLDFDAVVIRNGRLQDWGQSGITIRGNGAALEDLIVRSCGQRGIETSLGLGAGGSRVSRCTAESNGLEGIYVTAPGSVIDHCTARLNPIGIYATSGALVSNCTATDNSNYGIILNSGRCSDSVAYSNPWGFFASGGVIEDCTAAGNTIYGIQLGTNSSAFGNACINNGTGIYVSTRGTAQANRVTSNTTGILAQASAAALVVGNVALGNGTNYSIGAGNTTGTIVTTEAAINAAPNGFANVSL